MTLSRCHIRLTHDDQCSRIAGHAGACRSIRDGTAMPIATNPATASTDPGDSQPGGLANLDVMVLDIITHDAKPKPLAAPPPHPAASSAYYALIGPAPRCAPGDTSVARSFLERITTALEHTSWTRDERNRLRLLRDKWARRAKGKDPRFQAVGTRAGRVAFPVELAMRAAKKRGPRKP